MLLVVDAQPGLSPTQTRMLALCAQGCSREEIGRELSLSPWTVKDNLDVARKRLGARNLPHAVALSLGNGLLEVNVFGECIVPRPAAVPKPLLAAA